MWYDFDSIAIDVFQYQYECNPLYHRYVDQLNIDPRSVQKITDIPFLPISFFKNFTIKTGMFDAEQIFESSGTTTSTSSKHHVKSLEIYRKSFLKTFEEFYGKILGWCIIGLLPSYLERKNSSLVMMVEELISQSHNSLSGFYLDEFNKLHQTILHNEIRQQPTIIFGVTFALLDFAEKFRVNLKYTTLIETGGMKGRREELTREEVHAQLQESFGQKDIHSEYSMAELLSQAYSKKDGMFSCPPWMKILLREEDDPLTVKDIPAKDSKPNSGLINIIDLANVHSCAFIATDDLGKLHSNGNFEVLGRMDNSDIRGCSQLAL